jgi:hypothetical protein
MPAINQPLISGERFRLHKRQLVRPTVQNRANVAGNARFGGIRGDAESVTYLLSIG